MDDVLLLAPTRWKLRHATQVVNRVLSGLRLAKHPAKTFIGRISKGFDFLGYHFNHVGLTVAAPTVARFVARAYRLYEQEQREPCGPRLLGAYVRRWRGWARSGLAPQPPSRVRSHTGAPLPLTSRMGRATSLVGGVVAISIREHDRGHAPRIFIAAAFLLIVLLRPGAARADCCVCADGSTHVLSIFGCDAGACNAGLCPDVTGGVDCCRDGLESCSPPLNECNTDCCICFGDVETLFTYMDPSFGLTCDEYCLINCLPHATTGTFAALNCGCVDDGACRPPLTGGRRLQQLRGRPFRDADEHPNRYSNGDADRYPDSNRNGDADGDTN